MQEEICYVVPGPLDVLHIQSLMMTADLLSHGYGCPGLVILRLYKAHIERPEPIAQGCLRRNADQGGIDPTAQESTKRHITFHLRADRSHHQRFGTICSLI